MRDELEQIEAIISRLQDIPFDSRQIIEWKSIVLSETERIKKAFIREAFGLRKEKLVELYIQYHQSAIVQLIDRLVAIVGPEEIRDIHKAINVADVELPKLLYLNLENLLSYIEKHFSKYFNQNAKSPESYRFVVHRELKERLPDIRYVLEKKGINKRLLSIVLSPLDNFIDEIHKEEASYKKIIYLRELLSELAELSNTRLTRERLDFKLCLCLGYLNFNSHKFFKYCVREITRIVQDQDTLSKQIEKLAYIVKVVNQVQSKPDFVFNEKFRSIKDQLSDWLAEEICFFEKRQQLAINFPISEDEPIQKNFKLKINLSVSQLAYFLKCLKELKIIQNQNILEVLRFISDVVQTKHTENVSWESLRSKYYQVEGNARESIKDLALQLFNLTKKE